jgi:hypothetical protein
MPVLIRGGGGGGIWYKLPGAWLYIAYVLVFFSSVIICWLYKLNLPDQTQVTTTDGQSFWFSVEISRLSAVAAGPEIALSGPLWGI